MQSSNRFSVLAQPLPSSAVFPEDDDDDICPVCDGECTCKPRPQPPIDVPQRPPLKIKLSLAKRPQPSTSKKPPLKRRGRPPKPTLAHKHNPPQKQTRVPSSDLGDVDRRYASSDDDDDDDDAQSGLFPTFISASAFSSRASSSDAESSDLSSFDDSDSSIEAEEENFIVSEMEGRARVRRELFGDDVPKKRDPHNAWVIRPRKKSVGPSDVEMDVDSDATEDEDEDEDDEDDEDGDPDEEETDERGTRAGYVGLATGWTEDEDESSFDADLFFANLSDSEDHSSESISDGQGDHSDMESIVPSITSIPSMPPELQVQERWDGQIVFTNGLREGQGMLDRDFEAHALSFAETSPSPSSEESDFEMSDVDDGGYEQDADEGDGETTDEELVGEDDLPNERAMSLFMTPFSVSAINPMSTMSPAVSPGPRLRPSFARSIDSPKPADILSGKIFWDSDDYEEATTKSSSQLSSVAQGPRRGHFVVPLKDPRQAIIDDLHKDIPSPHPRFRRRRPSFAHFKNVEDILQRHMAIQQPPIACAPSPLHLVAPAVDNNKVVATTMAPETEMANAELVDLDDVLEPSILDPEPSDTQTTSTMDNGDSRKLLRSLNRWDVISVGAFRQSAEGGWAASECATPSNKTDYGSMMKSSPLSTMLWHNHNKINNHNNTTTTNNNTSTLSSSSARHSSRKMSVIISPVILPVRDGDRTPPNNGHHGQRNDNNYTHKSRKEIRRERKMKRKSYGALQNVHVHQRTHHQHQHHPNMKSRSTSSTQRNNFFSSVPPLNI